MDGAWEKRKAKKGGKEKLPDYFKRKPLYSSYV